MMETKNPGQRTLAGASVSIAADTETLSQNPAISQPQVRRFTVIVSPGFWRGYAVSVEPATCSQSPRGFPDHGAAMAFAKGLAQLEGWPILDRAGGEQ